ncbi:MAG: hypothetical protein H0T62_14455 [Parachlamydiaceae bacterium]|nr:hypothetical protein [Parachlamydiaceae bacterium]
MPKLKLQRLISEDLDKAMKTLENAGDITKKEMDELVLIRDFYRGILAGDLNGNKYKGAGGGVNGAVFFKHLESGTNILFPGETFSRPFLGVFKPHPMTVRERKKMFDYSQWAERGKSIVGMAALLNKDDPDRRVNNEIFAYEMYHIFGFNDYIGFPTTLKFANKNDSINRPASFCNFIPGLDAVEVHVHKVQKDKNSNLLDDPWRKYSAEELHHWQMSKLFDFLTGNLDGHEGNAFIKVEDGQLTGATNFDYDKAFTNVYQNGKIDNQYKWANLEISKKPLTSKTKNALLEIFGEAEETILTFLKKARTDGAKCFSENQENLLRLRIRALQKMARNKSSKLSDCKNWRTESDFAKL